ncbi:dynamin family protein [Amycolatopsis acidiphila]|uniref:GTP-binding protein n=1 Tax=Amycolatopsis acidiphila TaxID=715473 RepID=A0A558AMV9_9PSEU|nr:dynamin family protein [Amycolatopsis acidiphila]TVT25571.1 GTP-binding protein [Amycolatopsis acidiphila]UIJ60322.1 dynamin family protein [Amycolatopsis acidiphila]
MMAPPWLEVLDDTVRVCAAHRRADLVERLSARRSRLLDPKLRVAVVGESGQGKSQLINALLNAPVCAVGDDRTTVVPAVIEHAQTPTATVVTGGRLAIEGSARTPVAVESVTTEANREALSVSGAPVVRTEIGLPRALLAGGLSLVDTPARAALETVQDLSADAVLMATDATTELSVTELRLLEQIARLCPTVIVALTKIDLVPGWRGVAERTRARLNEGGLLATVFPVSATLRLAAARTGDKALNEESGFGELIRFLHKDLMGQADLLARRSVAALTGLAVESLMGPLQEEFAETQQSDTGDAVARWHNEGRRLERLQRDAGRWQTLLSDEVADLLSDVEFDLRDRTRRILVEVDEYFDAADPARAWAEFEDWLRENLTTVAETNSEWLLDRFEWIARKMARQVSPHRPDAVPESLPREVPADAVGDLRMPRVERFSVGQKLFVGMRGSYSGLLMFGLATTIAGLPLINPISLGAGAAFGAKSVFEERGNRLKRRQAAAKNAAHRYVDDFFLTYGKHSKDTARQIHRALRDRLTGVAEELRAEITESAKSIKGVIDTDAAQRNARANEIRRSVEELSLLRQRAQALGGLRAPQPALRGLTA